MPFVGYYLCRVKLDGVQTLLVWFGGDRDGLVTIPGQGLMHARSVEEIVRTAVDRGLWLVSRETTDYDLDRLQAWCDRPAADEIECSTFLNAWNFFDDLVYIRTDPDAEYSRLSEDSLPLYNQLFYGCNLPAMTPVGEHYEPEWSEADVEEIRRVLKAGIDEFRKRLGDSADAQK